MKTQQTSRTFLLIVATFVINSSFAQSSSDYLLLASNDYLSPSSENSNSITVSAKAQHAFKSYFANTQNQNWDMINGNYLITFKWKVQTGALCLHKKENSFTPSITDQK